MPRVQRRFLLRSRWTALVTGDDGACHFEIVAVNGDVVTLRGVLTARDSEVPLAALEDRAAWALGWRSRS